MTPPSPTPFVLCFLEGSHCVHYVQLILKDWGVKFHHLIEGNVSTLSYLEFFCMGHLSLHYLFIDTGMGSLILFFEL